MCDLNLYVGSRKVESIEAEKNDSSQGMGLMRIC